MIFPKILGRLKALLTSRSKPSLGIAISSLAPGQAILRLGSSYGGWEFIDLPSLQRCTIISCGLGEDASFGVEFAAKYGATVVWVDPTPRSIEHFKGIQSRCGLRNSSVYVDGGCQAIESYNLERIGSNQLTLVERAAWTEHDQAFKLFPPANSAHVSHSIYESTTSEEQPMPPLVVKAVPLAELISGLCATPPEIVKLDIEGAEIEVILHLLNAGIFPRQLLVEFDDLQRAPGSGRDRVMVVDAALRARGYKCYSFSKPRNYLYAR